MFFKIFSHRSPVCIFSQVSFFKHNLFVLDLNVAYQLLSLLPTYITTKFGFYPRGRRETILKIEKRWRCDLFRIFHIKNKIILGYNYENKVNQVSCL